MKKFFILLLLIIKVTSTNAQEIKDTLYIYFPFDQYDLDSSARLTLDTFLHHYRKQNSSPGLIINGHCDSLGSNEYNEKLSNKRSFAVQNYLLINGFPKDKIELVQGYGERMPLNNNSTSEEQQVNRRVEIVWTKRTDTTITERPKKDSVIEFSKEVIDTVKEGQTLRLRNINFYGGSHRFLPESMHALDELLNVMKNYPTLNIEIQGHICCMHGTPSDGVDYDSGDRKLSVNRARAVFDFLAEHGIDKKRMTYKGFSAKFPLVYPEYSEEDRTMNRRVEIKITKR